MCLSKTFKEEEVVLRRTAWLYPSVFPSILTDFENGLSVSIVKTANKDFIYMIKNIINTRTRKENKLHSHEHNRPQMFASARS